MHPTPRPSPHVGKSSRLKLAFALMLGCVVLIVAIVNWPEQAPSGMRQNNSQDPSSFGWVRAGPTESLTWRGNDVGEVAVGTEQLWTAMLDELVPTIPGGLTNELGC